MLIACWKLALHSSYWIRVISIQTISVYCNTIEILHRKARENFGQFDIDWNDILFVRMSASDGTEFNLGCDRYQFSMLQTTQIVAKSHLNAKVDKQKFQFKTACKCV